jgi:SAV_6107-like HEPN
MTVSTDTRPDTRLEIQPEIRLEIQPGARLENRPETWSENMPDLMQAAKVSASRMAKMPTVPAHMLPHRSPAELLAISRSGLAEASRTPADGLRYATAHLAALRAAAAVLAALARPEPRRRSRLTSVWALLAVVAPELGEWAAFFAAGASKRAAAEAGIPRAVTAREADDLARAAEQFVEVVAAALGMAYQPAFDGLPS